MAISTPVLVQNWFDNLNGDLQTTNQTDDPGITEGNGLIQLVAGRRYYALVVSHSTASRSLVSLTFDPGGADETAFALVSGAASDWDGGTKRMEVWQFNCESTTGSSYFLLDWSGSPSSQQMFLFYLDGEDDTGTNVQVQVATGTSTTPAVTFNTFGATDNLMLFFASTSGASRTFTVTESRVELVDDHENERFTSCVHYQNPHGSDVSVDATTTSDTWVAIGIEVKAGAAGVIVTPAHAEASAVAITPAVSAPFTFTATHAEGSALAVSPAVSAPETVMPAWAEGSALAIDPTPVAGSLDLTPAAAAARAAAVAPTVVEGSLAVTPEYAHTHTEAVAPTVTTPLNVTPDAAVARAQAADPTVVFGSLALTPAWAESSALAVDPTPVLGSLTVAPEYAHSHTDAFIVVVESGVLVIPAWAEASATAVEPTLVLGSVSVTPAAASARALAVEPTVVLGSLTVLPEFAHTHTEAAAPTVVLGSLTLTPVWAEASATAVEPVLVLGSLSVTPTPAEASATAPDPTVETGADVTVTPAFAAARALAVLLVVEQEGYRWRNDDGTEATATWQQVQDTPGAIAPGATVRLRMLVNGVSGDPVAEGYRLEYRKQGEQNWQVVN